MQTGAIQLERFVGLTKLPQKAATAWSALETSGLVGASYKPLIYLGEQLVNGVNYWFIAEQTLVTREPVRHVVKLAIYGDFDGNYRLLGNSIEQIA